MVKVGIIGIGFMGVTHYKALAEVSGAEVTALSTRDEAKLNGDWRSIQGNFGEAGGRHDVSQLARYANWHDLLRDPAIDLVDICLPTHLHRPVAIAALEAGKHVLVEKPLALSLEDADAMIAAAQRAQRQLMVGQVLCFFPAFAEALSLVKSGRYGALRAANLKRIISTPSWSNDDHFADAQKSGGPVLDLHIHDTHYLNLLAGVPHSVHAGGVLAANGTPTYIAPQYNYPGDAPLVTCQSGAIAMATNPFEHGFDIYLEEATLQHNSAFTGEQVWISGKQGETLKLKPQRPDGFVAQLQHCADCIAAGRESELISATSARQALLVCLKAQEALLGGNTVAI